MTLTKRSAATWYYGAEPVDEVHAKHSLLGDVLHWIACIYHPEIRDLDDVPYRSRQLFGANALIGDLVFFAPAFPADPWPGEQYVRDGVIVGYAVIRLCEVYVARLVLDPAERAAIGDIYAIRNSSFLDDAL